MIVIYLHNRFKKNLKRQSYLNMPQQGEIVSIRLRN